MRLPLPFLATPFFGRESVMEALAELGQRTRILSLLGGPGIGKTRLALEYGQKLQADGVEVGFSDLSGITTPDNARNQIRTQADVHGEDGLGANGPAVLILDNLEQLHAHAPAIVCELLAARPTLQVMTTSRVRLRIPGEHVLEVPPLSLPTNAEDFAQSGAGALFLDWLQAVRPDLEASSENVATFCALLERLDGLPLALELAASCLRVSNPDELLASCTHNLRSLRGPAGINRQWPTLESAIEFSWALLTPSQQAALTQCTVFRGGFDGEAADAVLDLSAFEGALTPREAVLDLVESGLIRALRHQDCPGKVRYQLFESVRGYAKAHASADTILGAQDRHASYYRVLTQELLARVAQTGDRDAFLRQRIERPNCRAAALRRPRVDLPENDVAISAFARMGDMGAVAQAHGHRGMTEHEHGRVFKAKSAYRDALDALEGLDGYTLLRAFLHGRLAACMQEQGLLEAADEHLGHALDMSASDLGARAQHVALAGTLAASRDDLAGAEDRLALAQRLLHTTQYSVVKDAVAVHSGHLSLARSRLAQKLGDTTEAERQLAEARARRDKGAASRDRSVRWAAVHLGLMLGEATAEQLVTMDEELTWVVAPCGAKVQLSGRRAPREILRALVEARENAPGHAVTKEELAPRGWPREELAKRIIAKRVQTAIWYLRNDCGLKDVIRSRHDGYFISSDVVLKRVPDSH